MHTTAPSADLNAIRIHTQRSRLLARHGEHDGTLQGRGMELDELSEYVDGDPLHRINWHATARSGTPIVNRFHPTQQMNIHLVLTLNASMLFGNPSKQAVATQVLSALAYAAQLQRDRLRVTLFDEDVHWELRPSRQAGTLEAIYEAASTVDLLRKQTDYGAMEHYLMATVKHPSVLFVIGDFLTLPLLDRLAGRHDLHLITIRSPEEERLGWRGSRQLFDPFAGTTSRVTVGARTALRYAKRMEEHDAALQAYCRGHRIDMVTIHTDDDPIITLAEHLRSRR